MSTTADSPDAAPSDASKNAAWRGAADEFLASTLGRLVAIGLVMAATTIPSWLVSGLIEEREQRQAGLLEDFKRSWGPEQSLHSPILVVPYRNHPGGPRFFLKIAPNNLKMTTQLTPEERKRGLFHATVYSAKVAAQGSFRIPSDAKIREMVSDGLLDWRESFVMLQPSSLSGMTAGDRFTWEGRQLPWQNCKETVYKGDLCDHGVIVLAYLGLTSAPGPDTAIPFQASIDVRGTGALRQLLHGKELDATVTSSWPSPSFSGTLLPTASTVTGEGFEARWQTADYTVPALWTTLKIAEDESRASSAVVDLIEAIPTYQMIHRASKYAILFVVLAFATYFLFEAISGLRIHLVQYGLMGLSLSLFGLLLLSFSEPLGYPTGYAVSALLVLLQASIYTGAISRRLSHAGIFAAMLACLFGFLYVVLGLEIYALLVSSVTLFVLLSVLMALAQWVDWSRWAVPEQTQPSS
ncbi:MAG TPA: cell envelope integrity protein CreD [Xanthobacteraceae bacterium]|jgi:inner membrane protein|nr:cell envelope integrity protein CreD [Xanthobacteraceae bacterium]